MPDRRLLLLVTFIESFATVLLERGLYFFTHEQLGFGDVANLWLALGFGVAYAGGAVASDRMARVVGQKRLLCLLLLALAGSRALMAAFPLAWLLGVGFVAVGLFDGMKWPLVESYIVAGQEPRQALRTIGSFNIAWAGAVPLAVAASGPIIASPLPWALLGGAAAINLVTLWLIRRLPAEPVHLAHDHPSRPLPDRLRRYRALLVANRWTMLSSYALIFLMAPLMPGIFARLGFEVEGATGPASLLDVVRVLAFFLLQRYAGWHGRLGPMVAVLVGLPVGFGMVLFGNTLWVVLVGQVIFGFAAGLTYYGALYYAMVVKNASVEAGGLHEGIIGGGFAVGPAVGLAGSAMVAASGSYVAGMLLGVAPLVVLTSWGAWRAVMREGAWTARPGAEKDTWPVESSEQ
jgi:MFS family permease